MIGVTTTTSCLAPRAPHGIRQGMGIPWYNTIHRGSIVPDTLYGLGLLAWGVAHPFPSPSLGKCICRHQKPMLNGTALLPQEKGPGRVSRLLTPTVAAIVVLAALGDPLGGNADPLTALLPRPPGREVSSEGVPRGGRPGWPQQGGVVKQKSVSEQLVSVIVAAPGSPLRGNRQNTEFATLSLDTVSLTPHLDISVPPIQFYTEKQRLPNMWWGW